jgi:hypothetical protein
VAAWELLGSTIYGDGPHGSRLGPIETVPALRKEDEVLPATLRVHPELLDDEAVVAEFTWHMQSSVSSLVAAFRNGPSTAQSNSTCTYTQAPGEYLFQVAPGAPESTRSLAEAQAWCCAHPASCGGVTKSKYQWYQCRLNSKGCKSPSNETSWIRKGATTPAECSPNHPKKTVGGGDIAAQAWRLLLSEKATLADVPQYRYDLIDFARQTVESNFSTVASAFKVAALAGHVKNASSAAATLLDMLDDYDELLGSDKNFMLGTWIKWSRSWSNDTKEQDFFEYNARNQITLWGPTGRARAPCVLCNVLFLLSDTESHHAQKSMITLPRAGQAL